MGLGAAAIAAARLEAIAGGETPLRKAPGKDASAGARMHIVTLSFDDGFRKSNIKIAELYEKYGLIACFNIIATADRSDFAIPNETLKGFGDWALWRELAARGHEIMPHGYKHINLTKVPFDEAKELTLKCLDVFDKELPGFKRERAVYNFPYNASTPELEAWLPTVVRAFRTGWGAINPLPTKKTVKITTHAIGPENCERDLDKWIDELLKLPSGWLVYNTHGLDDEGWGPIGSVYLDKLLDRLIGIPTVRVMPTGRTLDMP